MSFSLSTIAKAIVEAAAESTTVIAAGEAVISAFTALKPYIAALMEAAEDAYETSVNAGNNKLVSVIAALKAIASYLGVSWSDGLETVLSTIISTAKAAYNAFYSAYEAVADALTSDSTATA